MNLNLKPEARNTLSSTALVPLVTPGPNLVMHHNYVGYRISSLSRSYELSLEEFNSHSQANKVLKLLLILAAKEVCIGRLRHRGAHPFLGEIIT